MNAVLIAWFASMAVCSLYTFVLPAWDAYVGRRNAQAQASRPQSTNSVPALTRRSKAQSVA
jgi:hypothetical protein